VDLNFRTPVHYAAESGRLEAVKFILGHRGSNVDLEDNKAQKAVDLAPENNVYDVFFPSFLRVSGLEHTGSVGVPFYKES
jgi:hypothetical protein